MGRTWRLCKSIAERTGMGIRDYHLWDELKNNIRVSLNEKNQITDEEVYELIDDSIIQFSKENFLLLKDKHRLRAELFNTFRRLDILQEAIDNPSITEIMINGHKVVFVEENGVVRRWEHQFESLEQLEDMIQQVVSQVNRRVNLSSPIADARLPDGSRVHIVLPPVSLEGPIVTIRKFPQAFTMDQLIGIGAISQDAADFLKDLVRAGYNIFISGGTNSGKTTFLNALSAYIPNEERVITIEDSAELQIQHVSNLVRLEARNASEDGRGELGIGDLIRASLRMNPDRIIVGEVRGREALELLNSYNTGHDGGMSSGHGNSSADMLSRLETMVLTGADLPLTAIRSQIASAIDIIIHLGRLRDHSRKVLEIMEVGPYRNDKIEIFPLFKFSEHTNEKNDKKVVGKLEWIQDLQNREKLQRAGIGL